MAERADVVAEFIKELVSKDLVEAAQLLVTLDYPIPDKKSLVVLLEKQKTDNPQEKKADAEGSRPIQELIENVAGAFEPGDFGIDTPRSALEKFFARTRQDYPSVSLPLRRPPSLPDFGGPSEPGSFLPTKPAQIALAFGSGVCGRAARQLWVEHLAEPLAARLGPSPAYYDLLQERVDYCRNTRGAGFTGRCAGTGEFAYALCLVRGGYDRDCLRTARREYELCQRLTGGGPSPGP